MSEKITRLSAGVKANEIDLSAVSAPTPISPEGVPAGVIGTAKSGPAFVPVTVPNSTEFVSIFGDSKGDEFGPIALREWLRNANAGTYIRVLGVGDGKQKATSGIVTNAGYVVGSQQVQAVGDVGDNPYANGTLSTASRTYFVGCLMSESNGSNFLSNAGIQGRSEVGERAVGSFLTDAITFSANPSDGDTIVFTMPEGFGADDNRTITVTFQSTLTSPGANGINIEIDTGGTAGTMTRLEEAINGSSNASEVLYGSGFNDGETNGIDSLSAEDGSTSRIATLRAANTVIQSVSGELEITTTGANISIANSGNLTLGRSGNSATPVVRGVIFAPRGINLKLESHATHGETGVTNTAPLKTTEATNGGPFGATTGSITNGHEAVLYLNGYNQDANRSISFSFDPDSPSYLSNVLNTDPLKIEEKGHYLYADYPIYRSQAIPTGSGCLTPDDYSSTGEPIAFLMTGSSARNTGTSGHPNFENFENRYQRAFSPMFISQDMGARHNLFKVTALTDGEGPSTEFKVSIQNIKPATDPQYKYSYFDLIIRKFDDTDQKPVILESFTNLNLDLNSPRYICRIIGDEKISFNFDDTEDSQSIIIEGEYANNSKYIRIEPSSQLKAGQVPDEAVPFGFRGHYHLQTSGSSLERLNYSGHTVIGSGSISDNIVQPPVPMIQKLTVGTGAQEKVNSNIYWGPQFTKIQSAADPNKVFTNTSAILNFTKYFGDFRTDIANMWVGDNEGTANTAAHGVVDADLFNLNMFALDKVKVKVDSNNVADPKKWSEAIYVRAGNIVDNSGNNTKTRALKVADFKKVANRKYGKFTCFLQGGFDGVNVFDKEKSKLTDVAAHREFTNETNQGGVNGPTVASYRKAIDIMATDSDVDIQLLAIPGQRNTGVTDYAISAVESRFDAMYVMDVVEKDEADSVVTGSLQKVNIANTIEELKNRGVNSSFAATYFPDVVISHPDKSTNLTVPPSVVVLGAFSKNDSLGQPWFAPAGFNRTSLGNVIESTMSLKQENLDSLYDTRINPITSFAGTNLVIWGQKTLQQASNALDRVNVRRLLIEIRRLIRDAANQIIFEPNREETLVKFRSLVNPILQNVQDNQGLTRYKVVIDTTTTTQADVENNTIRGKILLQPTKTIEFVALDFVVTNNGTEI
jgi:phage tail sheath protein FI